jgi:hypothetical protein
MGMTFDEFRNKFEDIWNMILSMDEFRMGSAIKYAKSCAFHIYTYRCEYPVVQDNKLVYKVSTAELFYNHRSMYYYSSRFINSSFLKYAPKFMYEHATEEELMNLLEQLKILMIENI